MVRSSCGQQIAERASSPAIECQKWLYSAGSFILWPVFRIFASMNNQIIVILTSPGGKVGSIVKQSLEKHGIKVEVFDGPDAHRDTIGFIRELRKFITNFSAKTEGTSDRCNITDPCQKNNDIDASNSDHSLVILPVFYPEVLAEHRDEFQKCIIPLDTVEKIQTLDNKLKACELAELLDIPQPRRYFSADDVSNFPVVFKRIFGHSGDSVYFPHNKTALNNLISSANDYLITDFIEGENWCTDCLRLKQHGVNGGDKTTFRAASYRVLEPPGKGVSIRREAVMAPQIECWCQKILDKIDYQGVCEMDFRHANDKKFYFLECNPRFSGGIETTLESGFDIAWELISKISK